MGTLEQRLGLGLLLRQYYEDKILEFAYMRICVCIKIKLKLKLYYLLNELPRIHIMFGQGNFIFVRNLEPAKNIAKNIYLHILSALSRHFSCD